MRLDHAEVGANGRGPVLVHLPRRLEGEQAGGLDLHVGQGDVVLDHLVLGQQLAVRRPRHGPLAHDVEGSLGLPEPAHGVVDSAAAEPLLGQHEPVAGLADQMVGRHPAVPEHDLGVVARCARTRRRDGPWSPMSRTISIPGVPAGTTNTEACRWGRPSGLVSANTSTMSATEALVMNHLWPLITHSSPSLTAVVPMTVGSAPARNGSVRAKALEISPRRLGQSQRSFWASVAPWASSSMLPLSGAWTPKMVIDIMHRPMISDIRASFSWPKPLPPELRVEEGAPQALRLHLILQMALDHRPLVGRQLVEDRLERDQLTVDEGAHPGQLLGELGIGLEIPTHVRLSLSPRSDYSVIPLSGRGQGTVLRAAPVGPP